MDKRYHQTVLVSCEIPWDENFRFMENAFRNEVKAFREMGYNDLYIFGTAGEGYAVTTPMFQRIVKVFREETDVPGVNAMVGIIGMSTSQVMEKLKCAHEVGFRMFQISLPSWGTLTDNECMVFFRDVCGSFSDSKFLHYNLPRAGRVLQGIDYGRLQEAIPNLVATKNGGLSNLAIAEIMTEASKLQHFLVEPVFPYGCLQGECSLLASLGPLFPSKCKMYFECGRDGQFDKLFKLQVEFKQVTEAFFDPARGVARIDGAWDKMIVRASGIEMPLRLLPPYQGVDSESYEECLENLKARYPEWIAL